MRFPLGFPSLCRGARRYCRLGTGSDVRGVLVESNVLVAARTLEYLHLRSDVSSLPISSSQFLYTSICFPCCLQKSVIVSARFLYPARALSRRYDIRTLSLMARVPSLGPLWKRLAIVFGMYFLSESRRAFLEVRARNCSEQLPMRKVQRTSREKASMNAFEASV